MRMVVLPGDGIGPEITGATTQVLKAASEHFQLGVQIEEHSVGHESLRQFGTTVQPRLLEIARAADGLILGPTATFDFKNEQSGEINPSKYFRKNLDLFANVRPARTSTGWATFQRTHGKRVPQIVQSRTVSRPRPDASPDDQPVEGLLDGNVAKRPTALVDEHRLIA